MPLILEQLVPFDRELSVIAVRGVDGEVRDATRSSRTTTGSGILRLTLAPAPDLTTAGAGSWPPATCGCCSSELDYVGVLALELFAVGDRLLANEIAPRVHNSGHWTIEGARTSQFENHLRAVAGLPLGATRRDRPQRHGQPDRRDAAGRPACWPSPGAHLHLYGKAPRPGRKLGHVTVTGRDDLDAAVAELGIA